MTDDLHHTARWLREPASSLPPASALAQPVGMLQGVSMPAEQALGAIGIHRVLDLAASVVFGTAHQLLEASEGRGPLGASGAVPADLVDTTAGVSSLRDVLMQPPVVLRGLDDAAGRDLALALSVTSVRDLAVWPPYVAARRLLNIAYGGDDVSVDPEAPDELLPRMGRLPVDRVEYDVLTLDGPLTPPKTGAFPDDDFSKPLGLDDALLAPGFSEAAVGMKVTLAQSWYGVGLSLGQLLHSVALAPGEATRIAVVDWSRRAVGSVRDDVRENEELQNTLDRNRSVSEVTGAMAKESQSGLSNFNMTSAGWGLGGGAAGSYKGVTASLGFGYNRTDANGSSFASSQGERALGASLTQGVHDRTSQLASLVRGRRASVVSEVSTEESERLSTRIVANYNHMHALSVLYFEIVQVYRVVTECVRAEPVLYLPVAPLMFTEALVDRYRARLAELALTTEVRDALLGVIPRSPNRPRPAGSARPVIRKRGPRTIIFERALGRLTGRIERIAGGTRTTVTDVRTVFGAQAEIEDGLSDGIRLQVETARLVEVRVMPTSTTRGWQNPFRQLVVRSTAASTPAIVPFVQMAALAADPYSPKPDEEATPFVAILPPQLGDLAELTSLAAEKDLDNDAAMAHLQYVFALVDPATGKDTGTFVRVNTGLAAAPPYRPDQGHTAITLAWTSGEADDVAVTAEPDDPGASTPVAPPFDVLGHLRANAMYYTMGLLRGLDASVIGLALGSRWLNGRPLLGQIDGRPLTTAGNYLVFRWPAAQHSGAWIEQVAERGLPTGHPDDAKKVDARWRRESLLPMPSGGVFAEAVRGRFNSAEKLDLTRFWNWQDSPTPLVPPEIAPLQAGLRQGDAAPTPVALGAATLRQQDAAAAPNPGEALAKTLEAAANGAAFRDMSGMNTLLSKGGDAMIATAKGAHDFMKTAMDTVSAYGARVNHGKDMDERTASEDAAADTGNPPSGASPGGSSGAPGTTAGGTPGTTPASGSPGGSAPSASARRTPGTNEGEAFRGPETPPSSTETSTGPVSMDLSVRCSETSDSGTLTMLLDGMLTLRGLVSVEAPDGIMILRLRQGFGAARVKVARDVPLQLEGALRVEATGGVRVTVPTSATLPGTAAGWYPDTLQRLVSELNQLELRGVVLPAQSAPSQRTVRVMMRRTEHAQMRVAATAAGLVTQLDALDEPMTINLTSVLAAPTLTEAQRQDLSRTLQSVLEAFRDSLMGTLGAIERGSRTRIKMWPIIGMQHVSFDAATSSLVLQPMWLPVSYPRLVLMA